MSPASPVGTAESRADIAGRGFSAVLTGLERGERGVSFPAMNRWAITARPYGTPIAARPYGTPIAARPYGTPIAARPSGTPIADRPSGTSDRRPSLRDFRSLPGPTGPPIAARPYGTSWSAELSMTGDMLPILARHLCWAVLRTAAGFPRPALPWAPVGARRLAFRRASGRRRRRRRRQQRRRPPRVLPPRVWPLRPGAI